MRLMNIWLFYERFVVFKRKFDFYLNLSDSKKIQISYKKQAQRRMWLQDRRYRSPIFLCSVDGIRWIKSIKTHWTIKLKNYLVKSYNYSIIFIMSRVYNCVFNSAINQRLHGSPTADLFSVHCATILSYYQLFNKGHHLIANSWLRYWCLHCVKQV